MNRKASRPLPRTVCGVVYEKKRVLLDRPVGPARAERRSLDRAQEIAEEVYYGRHQPVLNGALFFHATYVKPDWAKPKRGASPASATTSSTVNP